MSAADVSVADAEWRALPFDNKLRARARAHVAEAMRLLVYAGDHARAGELAAVLNALPVLPDPPGAAPGGD